MQVYKVWTTRCTSYLHKNQVKVHTNSLSLASYKIVLLSNASKPKLGHPPLIENPNQQSWPSKALHQTTPSHSKGSTRRQHQHQHVHPCSLSKLASHKFSKSPLGFLCYQLCPSHTRTPMLAFLVFSKFASHKPYCLPPLQ